MQGKLGVFMSPKDYYRTSIVGELICGELVCGAPMSFLKSLVTMGFGKLHVIFPRCLQLQVQQFPSAQTVRPPASLTSTSDSN